MPQWSKLSAWIFHINHIPIKNYAQLSCLSEREHNVLECVKRNLEDAHSSINHSKLILSTSGNWIEEPRLLEGKWKEIWLHEPKPLIRRRYWKDEVSHSQGASATRILSFKRIVIKVPLTQIKVSKGQNNTSQDTLKCRCQTSSCGCLQIWQTLQIHWVCSEWKR